MNRSITALPKTLVAAPPLFQTALPLTVANLGRGDIRKCGTIVKTIWRRPQAAAIAIRPANDPHGRAQPWRASDDVEFRPNCQRAKCEHGTGASPP